MTIQVEEMMNTNLFTLPPEATLAQAKHLMAEQLIRHIPIVNDSQQLVGLVSHRDILATGGMHTRDKDGLKLSGVMTTSPYCISPKTGVKQAAQLIKREKYGCLPVLSKGELVGIVTGSDFVQVAIILLEMMEANEPEALEQD